MGAISNPARRRIDGYVAKLLTGGTLVPQGAFEYRNFTDIRHTEVVYIVYASAVES